VICARVCRGVRGRGSSGRGEVVTSAATFVVAFIVSVTVPGGLAVAAILAGAAAFVFMGLHADMANRCPHCGSGHRARDDRLPLGYRLLADGATPPVSVRKADADDAGEKHDACSLRYWRRT
jgi:hypothetical protein